MASPPPPSATSPPNTSIALPRQRPNLALPGTSTTKSRKPSIASTTSSSHPLRQTSFPPPDSLEAQHAAAEDSMLLQYSPTQGSQGSEGGEEEFSDSEIVSAISGQDAGMGVRKRKRGEKKPRGRPAKMSRGSVSLVDGEEGQNGVRRGGTAGAQSVVTADNADDEDEGDDDDEGAQETGGGGGRQALYEGGQMTADELNQDNENKGMFRNYMDVIDSLPLTAPERNGMTYANMGDRYDVWYRAKLRQPDVRKLVNQTLSQSVPQNVVTVVSAYTKMFAGLLIEEAREVQAEWMAVEKERADGESNSAYQQLRRARKPQAPEVNGDTQNEDETGASPRRKSSTEPIEAKSSPNGIKQESSSPTAAADTTEQTTQLNTNSTTQPNTQIQREYEQDPIFPDSAAVGLESSLPECDRGPLLPDHLREALRRIKKSRKGGTVGFTGLSLEGREVAAARMGGRRLFK